MLYICAGVLRKSGMVRDPSSWSLYDMRLSAFLMPSVSPKLLCSVPEPYCDVLDEVEETKESNDEVSASIQPGIATAFWRSIDKRR